jgi:hypothetical protein
MALLTEELKEQIAKVGVCHLVTASKAGVPNAAPMGAFWIMDNDTIWIANNFMNKTIANIKENPQVSLLVWSRDIGNCFQLKGTAEVEAGTADHKKMKELLDAKKPGLPGKELVKITVKEIFTCMPGPDAGKKL